MGESEGIKKGKFIVFEGLDGSGKTTIIRLLCEKLKEMGKKITFTAEPTNSSTGGLIRDTLNGNFKRDKYELAALFLADRIYHNTNCFDGIHKMLYENNHVICDRYYYSSFAFQGMDVSLQWLMDMHYNCEKILIPDLCIFLDVDPATCMKRIDKTRGQKEIYETDIRIMEKTREQFYTVFDMLKSNKRENIYIVDSNKPLSVLLDEISIKVLNTMD